MARVWRDYAGGCRVIIALSEVITARQIAAQPGQTEPGDGDLADDDRSGNSFVEMGLLWRPRLLKFGCRPGTCGLSDS